MGRNNFIHDAAGSPKPNGPCYAFNDNRVIVSEGTS
jgi:hypothetical protein